MSGYERLKRWRSRNHALVNLRQREYRNREKGESIEQAHEETDGPKRKKIDELRQLVATEIEKPFVTEAVPLVYRDDYGRVITQSQWNALRANKEREKAGGYEVDDYAQA